MNYGSRWCTDVEDEVTETLYEAEEEKKTPRACIYT